MSESSEDSDENENPEYDYENYICDENEKIDIQMGKHFENIFYYAEKKTLVFFGNFTKIIQAYNTILEDNEEEFKTIPRDNFFELMNFFDPIYKKILRLSKLVEDEYIKNEMDNIFTMLDPGHYEVIAVTQIHLFYENMYQFSKNFKNFFLEKAFTA